MVCYRCQRPDHLARDCQAFVRTAPVRSVPKAKKLKVAGRIFTMSGVEASKFSDLVQGVCEVVGNSLFILFDSRATHSFISYDCVKRLKLSACPLSFNLLVSTPTTTPMKASLVCVRCLIVVSGHSYKVNLISLPLANLDIILGMD